MFLTINIDSEVYLSHTPTAYNHCLFSLKCNGITLGYTIVSEIRCLYIYGSVSSLPVGYVPLLYYKKGAVKVELLLSIRYRIPTVCN